VSVARDGSAGADGPSGAPLLSADGRWVFFESLASNLVENDLNQTQDIFARDRLTGTTLLVSADANGPGTNSGPAHSAAITPDGRFVAFVKNATNVINPLAGRFSAGEVYVRDMERGTTTWASSNAFALFFPFTPVKYYLCFNPVLSADGRFVVFKSAPTNAPLGRVLLLRHDLLSGQTDAIHSNAATQSWAQVSADGRWVAYDTGAGIELWDAQSASNRLICTNVNVPGPLYRTCSLPALNTDGSRLAYVVRSNGVASLYAQDLPAGSPRLLSVTTNGLPASVTDAWPALLSAEGSVIVFDALDERLVPGDSNLAGDVFAADWNTGALELISRRHEERPGLTPPLFSLRHPRSLSADGRVSVFGAFDRALSDMDTNGLLDLYVRDLGRNTLHFPGDATNRALDLVVSADGRYSAYGFSHASTLFPLFSATEYAVMWTDLLTASNRLVTSRGYRARFPVFDSLPLAISADGIRVAFQSLQSPAELLAGPFAELNGVADVYLQDIVTGSNQLVSVNRDGSGTGNGASTEPLFTPDGRWLLFRSSATDLSPEGAAGLYARDLPGNQTLLLNPFYARPAYQPILAVSADSRVVASFSSDASIRVFDLLARTSMVVRPTQFAVSGGSSFSLSATGRWLASDGVGNGLGDSRMVHLLDLQNGTDELISTRFGDAQPANGNSYSPLLSYDARFVVFASDASDLVPNDRNAARDVFVHDRFRHVTFLASVNRSGTGSGNGESTLPVLAADGRTVLFQSLADDLVGGDYNGTGDVFVLQLGGPDTDGDGMDDDWEMAYFNTLDRDGSGDWDGDGRTDLEEFRAGTDPTDRGSVLQVLSISRLGSGQTKLLWSATPGTAYQVQFKDDITDGGWGNAGIPVTAGGTTATWDGPEAAAGQQRFYRVALAR
jgi:Tol biopolymer transport system component